MVDVLVFAEYTLESENDDKLKELDYLVKLTNPELSTTNEQNTADKAINENFGYEEFCCTREPGENPNGIYWQAKFGGQTQTIHEVRLFNRNDYGERLEKAEIFVDGEFFGKFPDDCKDRYWYSVKNMKGVKGSSIKVVQTKQEKLHFIEIQVFAKIKKSDIPIKTKYLVNLREGQINKSSKLNGVGRKITIQTKSDN